MTSKISRHGDQNDITLFIAFGKNPNLMTFVSIHGKDRDIDIHTDRQKSRRTYRYTNR